MQRGQKVERKTKIVCTLGPKSFDEPTIIKMINAGMNVARINMSHRNADESTRELIEMLKRIREEMKVPLAIMIDTKGPEVRIGALEPREIDLVKDAKVTLNSGKEFVGDVEKIWVNYNKMHKDIKKGARILLNDGLVELIVKEIVGNDIICVVNVGGKISSRKSIFMPGVALTMPFLGEIDKIDLKFAAVNKADYVAISFVNEAKNVKDTRKWIDSHGGQGIEIISKIESVQGLDNIDAIIEQSDGIMVARGDLGVELPIEKLPGAQKMLIKKAKHAGKTVIVATEMLESMINKMRPTRAETTDVANAVFEGACAVMLSGETAIGIDPPHVIKTMANICKAAEDAADYARKFGRITFESTKIDFAVAQGACTCAIKINANVICAMTNSGATARLISKLRPPATILGITPYKETYHKLALTWGVVPVLNTVCKSVDDIFERARMCVTEQNILKPGERYVVTAGMTKNSCTNLMKVETFN